MGKLRPGASAETDIRVSGNSEGQINPVFSGCLLTVSDLSYSPLSEHPGRAGVLLGCWKLGPEPFFSPGFLFRVWPHLGHDIYSLERDPNLRGWAGFPPRWKGEEGVGIRGPEASLGKRRKRIN